MSPSPLSYLMLPYPPPPPPSVLHNVITDPSFCQCRWACLRSKEYPEEDTAVHKMVMNIGQNPTVNPADAETTVEIHVLHKYSKDFYGQPMHGIACGFIRCVYSRHCDVLSNVTRSGCQGLAGCQSVIKLQHMWCVRSLQNCQPVAILKSCETAVACRLSLLLSVVIFAFDRSNYSLLVRPTVMPVVYLNT